tara:strand:+ start:318 stop:590 length:273 start_codon:yes stop_codon:yes gene_type:complete
MGEEARGRQAQPSAELENDYLSEEGRLKKQGERGKGMGFEFDAPSTFFGLPPSNMPVRNPRNFKGGDYKRGKPEYRPKKQTSKKQFPKGI